MPQGRRVRRVVRKIDTWTVLRFSLVFWVSLMVIGVIAGVVLWAGATSVGVFGNVSKFMASLGFENFKFRGGVILRATALLGIVVALLATAASVLVAVLYNLISDVVGGIQLIVLEEEPVGRAAATRPMRVIDGAGPGAMERESDDEPVPEVV